MKLSNILFILIVLINSNTVFSEPEIDGNVSAQETNGTLILRNFVTTKPLTFSTPSQKTKVYVKAGPHGLYIAFKNSAMPSRTIQKTTLRDEDLRADYNEVIIDFDGSGGRAYGFKLSRTSSIQDSVWSSDNTEKMDWDGGWQFGTTETDSGWNSEFYIPWSIVARADNSGDIDKVKVYFSRWDTASQQRLSFPGIDRNSQRFLANFHEIIVDRTSEGSLDIYPYISADYSIVDTDINYKSGVDIFWKPSPSQQFNVAINPDYGQVESDELVVNLSAIETFFAEKRPFFAENHDLFDLQGPESLRLVHTPRIGSEPDGEDPETSNIKFGAKYVSINEHWDYGLLSSHESGNDSYGGRRFSAARLLHKTNNINVGALQTYVEEPRTRKQASVTAIDYEQNLTEALSVSGQMMYSRITNSADKKRQSDSAYWIKIEYAPIEVWTHELTAFHYGRDFQVNDFGFVKRVNRQQLEYKTEYEWANFSAKDRLAEISAELEIEYKTNDQNHQLPLQTGISFEALTRNTSEFQLSLERQGKGKDDLLTRGGNPVDLPSALIFGAEYHSAEDHSFQYSVTLETGNSGFDKRFLSLEFLPSYQFGENINIGLEIGYEKTDSWLLWLRDNEINEYKNEEFSLAINLASTFRENHEFRLKLESVALKASLQNSFTILPNGESRLSQTGDDEFSIGEFAIQLRYRYSLGLLSDFYIVYSRGGEVEQNDETPSHLELLQNSVNQQDIESIFMKIKFHF